ncbi:phosphatidylinositol-glycan biosynthesis class S protein-domain-containing protein [Lipomyces japonicus]|uniref:phosphatidylinositol-glycan biosynthesis class S protein-domain-containing protein n=1 Tax=Lipomyces japonicus TaxID=56871 RepID=UPI0034CF7758
MTLAAESHQSILTRRYVVFSFWFVFACVGLPLWVRMTAIHRTPLPATAVAEWTAATEGENKVPSAPRFRIGVDVASCGPVHDIITAAAIDTSAWGILDVIDFVEEKDRWTAIYTVKCQHQQRQGQGHSRARADPPGSSTILLSPTDKSASAVAKAIQDAFAADLAITVRDDHYGGQVIIGVPYADSVHLSFTMLIALNRQQRHYDVVDEDDKNDFVKSINDSLMDEWAGEVARLRGSLARELAGYVNLTYDSDVVFRFVDDQDDQDDQDDVDSATVDASAMTMLLNSWDLPDITTTSAARVLQFVYYVPTTAAAAAVAGSKKKNVGFTVWPSVGVVIAGNVASSTSIRQAMRAFRSHAIKLLAPAWVVLPSGEKILPAAYQFSRVAVWANVRAAKDTVDTLMRLVDSQPAMAVPASVSELVSAAVRAAVAVATAGAERVVGSGNTSELLALSARAAGLARKAIFDKDMVVTMFVPLEHKVAVYLPLLGPVFVPLAIGLRRVLKEYKK